MRHLTINQFSDTPRSFVGETDNLPAPFPGKFPTRIAWKFQGFDRTWSYVGKPSRQAVLDFNRLMSTKDNIGAFFVEFDRKHMPIYSWSQYRGLWVHNVLWGVYHHWNNTLAQGAHFLAPTYRRRLAGLMVYSPFRALSIERKQIWFDYVRAVSPTALKESV